MTLAEFLEARIAEDEKNAWFDEQTGIISGRGFDKATADFASKRMLIADLLSERHEVVDADCWYTCAAATEERDGGECCDDGRRGEECDCGRDERVYRRLKYLALPYADHPECLRGWMK